MAGYFRKPDVPHGFNFYNTREMFRCGYLHYGEYLHCIMNSAIEVFKKILMRWVSLKGGIVFDAEIHQFTRLFLDKYCEFSRSHKVNDYLSHYGGLYVDKNNEWGFGQFGNIFGDNGLINISWYCDPKPEQRIKALIRILKNVEKKNVKQYK